MNMKKHEEKRAKELERLLKKGGVCHDPVLGSLQEISKSLSGLSKADASDLSPEVVAKQRALLMSKSNEIKQAEVASKEATKGSVRVNFKESARQFVHSWKMAVASFGTVALVTTVIVMLVLPRGVTLYPQEHALRRISDLVIPSAMAADAFAFEAEMEDAGGVSTSTAFIIHSKIDLSEDALSSHLVIIPAREAIGAESSEVVAVRVEKQDAETFRVTPVSPLDPGTVYRVEIRGAIQREDGELQARTFSWAIQTKDIFRVLSSVPGDASSIVPVNTVIEVTVNMDRLSDPASHFRISPDVKGKFQTNGRTITFIPDQPLAYGTVYTATWSKDWGLEGSNVLLDNDYVVRFETISKVRADAEAEKYTWIRPWNSYVATAHGKVLQIPMYSSYGGVNDSEIRIEGYTLTRDQAVSYLIEDGKRPWFGCAGRDQGSLEGSYAKTQSFTASSTLQNEGWADFITLPNTIPQGYYLVKLSIADQLNSQPSWVYLNVTDTAAYIIGDKDQYLVWVMNATEERPLADIVVSDGTQIVKTDKDGIARLKTPADAVDAKDLHPTTIIRVGEGSGGTLLPLSDSMNLRSYQWYDPSYENASNRTVAYLHVDRPLYHPTDTAEVSGMIQDRETERNPLEPMTVSLMQRCYAWSCDENNEAKVFERTTVMPDEKGFFRATLSWENVGGAYYTIVLKRGDTVVQSQGVEIRRFSKPDYTVESTPDRDDVFAGEKITGTARAAFFDGTPVSNLKLNVNGDSNVIEATTNEDGLISYSFDTQVPNCNIDQDPKSDCQTMNYYSVMASPSESEATSDIFDQDSIAIWNTNINLVPDWNTTFKDDTATVSVRADNVILPVDPNIERSHVSGLDIRAVVFEHWWEKIQDGTGYNEIEKTTYPKYRYERREEKVATLNQKTNAEGKASFSFTFKKERTYEVIMYAKDNLGHWSVASQGVYPSYWRYTNSEENADMTYVSFGPTEEQREDYRYHENETVSLSLKSDERLLPRTSAPTYLYVKARLGIKDAMVSVDPTVSFPFDASYAPNITVKGIVFRQGGFREFSTDVVFNTDARELSVNLSVDRASYAPGSEATIHVQVKDADGKPKRDARVALAVVDEALFKATFSSVDEDALRGLYASVDSGILFSAKTHRSDEDTFFGGGGEMGGGGGEASRKNFKDTAGYDVVTTNASGEAELKMKLPDNITTWRVSGVAVSPDRYGGSGRVAIKVTKQVFVNVVVPETFLEADRPQMKLRAYGVGLKAGEDITYSIDAPTLGMKNREVRSKVGASVYLAIDAPVAGTHAITIRLKSSTGADAIEKKISIVTSRFTRDEGVRTDVSTDTKIDIGSASDVNLSFVPKNRAQYLQGLYDLRGGWSQRVEGKIASQISGMLLRDYFGEDVSEVDSSQFAVYQKTDGGIAMLPHASSDIALSSRVAYTYPEGFDRIRLAKYLRQQLEVLDAPREIQIEALAGLASIGEPVLIDLRSVAVLKDLTWREKISVMRGLIAIGDAESARPFLNEFLDGKEIKDGALIIDVSGIDAEDQEATVQLAAIAIRLGDSRVDALRHAVTSIWNSGVYAPLAQIDYLKVAVPAAIGGDASVTYQVNGKKTKIELTDGWPHSVRLIAKEAKDFSIVEVNGPIEMTYLKQVATKPQIDGRVTLKRTYLQGGDQSSGVLKDGGDVMTVEIQAEIAKDAPEGCYTVQDHIPAGFSAMTGWNWLLDDWKDSYVSPFEAQDPTFVICTDWGNRTIRYRVKPTARGTYLAEPAVIQSMDHPEVTGLSDEQKITIE
jgi:hypothetical protein